MRFLDNVVKDDDKTELINSFSTLAKSRCVTISDQQLITDYIVNRLGVLGVLVVLSCRRTHIK